MLTSARIQDLKRDLGALDDFGQLMCRFFDCVEADPALVTDAEVHRSRDLRRLLEEVASSLLGRPARASGGELLRVARHRMVHGACWMAGLPATLVWFEDLRQGLMAIVMGDGETRFARFTQLDAAGVDSPDPALN
jgi:hypothetical protein